MLTYSHHTIPFHGISYHFIPFLFFDGEKSLTMLSRVFISASPSTPLAFVFVFTPTYQGMFLLLVVEVKLYNAHILIPYHTISQHSYFFVRNAVSAKNFHQCWSWYITCRSNKGEQHTCRLPNMTRVCLCSCIYISIFVCVCFYIY